jgi:hypothetical protein
MIDSPCDYGQTEAGFTASGQLWVESNRTPEGGALIQVGNEFLDELLRTRFCRDKDRNGEVRLKRVRITVERMD